jgi:hypothetical protein
MAAAVDGRHAAAGDNEEPLSGATMPIRRIAFGFARLQHHSRGLRPLVAKDDVEAFAEPKRFAFHGRPRMNVRRYSAAGILSVKRAPFPA